MLIPWTALRSSQHAKRWRWAAIALAVSSIVCLLAAAVVSTPFAPLPAILAVVAALVAWIAARPRAARPLQIGVSSTGSFELRDVDGAAESAGEAPWQVRFAAPWLISLQRGTMCVSIWPDSLPPEVFRRLWVHLRWKRVVPRIDDPPALSGPPHV